MQSEAASTDDDPSGPRSVVWLMRIAWIALVCWACVRGYLAHPSRDAVEVSRWINADIARTEQLVRRLIFEWCTDIASFVAIGMVSFLVLSTMLGGWRAKARVGVIVAVGIAVCGLVRGVELSRLPAPGHLLVPLCAYLLGAWVLLVHGSAARGSVVRALAGLLGQMAAFLILMGVVMVAVAWLSLQDRPLPIEAIEVSMGDKRRLANTLRGSRAGPNGPAGSGWTSGISTCSSPPGCPSLSCLQSAGQARRRAHRCRACVRAQVPRPGKVRERPTSWYGPRRRRRIERAGRSAVDWSPGGARMAPGAGFAVARDHNSP